MKKIIFCLVFLLPSALMGNSLERLNFIPQAGGLNYGEYNGSFRIYSDGGVLVRSVFSVIQGFYLGFSWDVESLIGTSAAHGRNPRLYLKFDVYRGGRIIPAISIGYDSQGWGRYFDDEEEYEIPALGFFAVATKEAIIPGLFLSGGASYNSENKEEGENTIDAVSAFAGFEIKPNKLGIFGEAMDIGRGKEICYVNSGIIFEFTEGLEFKLAFENITEAGKIREDLERTLILTYRGAF